ncbi:hypothetical protein ACFFWD_34125 [Bradyrhizobium erythrophlei]|uniref:hypothetical protein n=1 Tax=Bradyrhizobium erythrophlei TaxID=1437360 RepID=UPI0035E6745F
MCTENFIRVDDVMESPKLARTLEVLESLAGDECHDSDDANLIVGLGRRLRSAGLPVDRLTLHLRTLHPEILGRTVAWSPQEPVQIMDRENGLDLSTDFVGSPVRHVMQTLEHSIDPNR